MQGGDCIHEASYVCSMFDLGWGEALCYNLVVYAKETGLF